MAGAIVKRKRVLPRERLARALYSTLGTCVAATFPLLLPLICVNGRWRKGMLSRLTLRLPSVPPGAQVVWLHAASVGEVLALVPLVELLKRKYPHIHLALSSQTSSALGLSLQRLPQLDARFYFPLDLPGLAARVLDRLRPCLVVFTETELWPGLLFAAADRGIPAVMVSGRLSPSALRWYRRGGWVFGPSLGLVMLLCVQSREDGARLVELGADPDKVIVTGSLKTVPAPSEQPRWVRRLAARGSCSVFVAGSTHKGEEEQLLAAFSRVRRVAPHALLVLAPRHPQRFEEVGKLVEQSGLPLVRRSQLREGQDKAWTGEDPAVVLLDTIGELASCYRGAAAAFVGGSLVPVGGHNLFEPALSRCPVLFGPHTGNTEEAARLLVSAGGGVRIAGEDDLVSWLGKLLSDRAASTTMGDRAFRALAHRADPLRLTAAAISPLLDGMP